jgi:transcriptional regulator with XRE-family HTH domain
VSQRALADRSGVSRSYLCDIERGRGAQPRLATLDKLAAALGASRADLLRVAGVLESPSTVRSDAAELRVVALYRDLSGDNRALVERFVRFLHHEEHHRVQVSLPDGLATEGDGRGERPAMGRQTGPMLFDVLVGQRQAGD